MAEIEKIEVTNSNLSVWGTTFNDYTYNKVGVDFQDLMVRITERRATSVEKEVSPLSTRMKNRNTKLSQYGDLLSTISGLQANFKTDDGGTKWLTSTDYGKNAPLTDAEETLLENLIEFKKRYDSSGGKTWSVKYADGIEYSAERDNEGLNIQKYKAEELVQLLKTKIDLMNNEASEDMTRLQGIVDRRDQSYTMATTLMQAIADTRGSLIKNL